jgi:hypothetical protein
LASALAELHNVHLKESSAIFIFLKVSDLSFHQHIFPCSKPE